MVILSETKLKLSETKLNAAFQMIIIVVFFVVFRIRDFVMKMTKTLPLSGMTKVRLCCWPFKRTKEKGQLLIIIIDHMTDDIIILGG